MISASCLSLPSQRPRFLAWPGWPYLESYLGPGLKRPRRIVVEPFQADCPKN